MKEVQFYRYFIGCRPNAAVRSAMAQAAQAAQQRLLPDLYHLTFCVVLESRERDPSIVERVCAALVGADFRSAPIAFGRVAGGPRGAVIKAAGRQHELQDLYGSLVHRLRHSNLKPLYRKSGFHPHLTLGYEACHFLPFDIWLDWIPNELLLIESEVGLTRHNVLGRWPLLAPRQRCFDFGPERPTGFPSAPTAAAGPARRSAA